MWEGSTMRGYARLFALCITLLAILIPQQAAAAYRLSTGGCFGDAQYTPAQLMDPVQNRRASSFLRSVGCPVAGLGGFVSGRQLFWNNGEPISWFPNSLNVDSPDFSGFIALQDNGLWSAKPFDDYSHTEFLCMNGTYSDSVSSSINSPVVPTQEPPSTNVPTTTTTTVTTVEPTSSPQPTTFSLELTITLMHMALNMLGKIDVVEYTANALVLPLSAEVKRSVQQLLQEGVVIRLGFGLGSVPSSYAALLQSKTSRTALEFVLPWEVLSADSSAVFHIFLVVRKFHDSDSTIPSISPVVTTCTIHVHSFVDVLVNLNEDLMLWGEDEPQQLEDPSNHSIGLTLFGEPSTLAPFTTDVSPIAWESIDLYLVNHGRPGGHCIASTTSISFAMVHHRLYLSIPQSLRLRVHAARKSMCAVVRGKRSGIVVAILGLQSFQATTTQAVWNVEELLPVRMSGITFFSVVAGRVGAFLSNSPKCTTNTSAAALIVASSSDRLSPWAFIRATSEVVGGAAYVCLRTRILSVPVRDADGIPARFTPPTISALEDEPQTVPEVLLLRGLLGSINLVEYVERSPEDINVEGTIHNLVSDSSLRHIRCVVVAPDASTEERQSQCVEQTDSIDTFPLVKGIATVDHPINFTGHGIFCLGEHYVGITYTSTPIADWVKSFESHTVEATGTIADVLLVGDQLSAVLMQIQGPLVPFLSLRLSTDACLSGYTTSLENYTSNQLVAVLPHNLAGLYQLCVGLQTAHGTAAFAPLTITTRLISYARAWEFWITAKDEERWRPCGPTAVCEVSPEPSYVRLCSVSGAFEQGRRIWPRKLETQLNYRGGFHVLGVNHLVSAVVLDGEVFARLEDVSMEITCVKHLQLELSTDGVVYGTHAIMSPLNPTTWIDAPWQYRGAVVRFVDAELESWNASPDAHSAPLMISQSGTQVLIDGTLNVMNRTSTAYVRLCYRIRSHDWRSIDGDVLTLSPYVSGLSEVRVEALGVPGALSVIDLYATQVTRWRLEGIFDASMHAALYFIPAAQSCIYTTATNAVFHAPITYEGSSSAVVDIDVSHIDVQLEGEESARLRACYSLSPGRGKLLPLGAEEEQERDIVVHGLSLKSINLQASCRVECQPQSSTISFFLSPTSLGENDAPIAQLMLLEGEYTTDAQCVRSAPQFIAVVPVHHHPRWGFRTVQFPLSVLPARCPAQVHFCASVDDSANASFKPIQAYLNFGDEGPSELCASPVVLLLAHYVQQVNAYETEDETPPNALRSFIASRTSVPAESIRMMSLQPNTIAVAVNQPGGLQEVYDVMATHTLPLLSTHDADLSFSAVEGVEWPSLRPAADFPIILLNSGAESKSTTPWTTWLLRASCLAAVVSCVIMAAVAVCRPMPSFTDRLETSPQALRRTPTAARNFVIEGNSPPPRDPQAARDYLDAKERMAAPAVLFHSRWEEEVEQSGTLQRAEE